MSASVAHASRNYKYYDFILGAFVCVLLCSNLIGPAKVATVNLPVIGDFEIEADKAVRTKFIMFRGFQTLTIRF